VSDTFSLVYGKVIRQAIKDLVCNHDKDRESAIKYLKSQAFSEHCQTAGYPSGLRNTLEELLLLSATQQRVVVEMVMERLSDRA